ncbi:MAG: right-handed parallel beta-helix repeat-containing protein [Flavobacteriales bacterium]|nr:right-handed parallel beta-helix repeat-containing protein [Flavobacteriales bacterium]
MSLWEYSAWFQNQEAYNVGIDEEGSERAQFDKFMSTWGPRLFPTGNFNQVGLASQEHIAYLSARFGNDGIYASSWTSIGPNESPLGPAGEVLARSTGTGQIHAIAFHPEFASNGIMYCASSYGGLFRSADHGSSWSAIADEREFTPVSAIVVSQIDPNVVFISTGGSDNVLAYCTGVWRSTDGGDTWESISGGLDIDMTNRQHILNMAVDPANQDLAIAATTEGLYRTTNAMAPANQVQWTEVFDSPTGNFWKGLFFKEGTTVVYAADANVYRSTDQGLTWTAITGPTTGLEPSTLSPAGTRINLAPEKGASSTKVYAMLQQGYSTRSRAYVYDETTETWSGGTIIASGGTSVGWIPIATTTVAGQDQFITYGGLRLYKSTNGGTTVSLFGDGLLQNPDTYERIHDDQQVAAFTPDGAELWIGNHGGIHRCTNPFGATPLWENRNIGLGVGLVTALASDPTHPSSIISGEFDNGVRRLLPSAPTENRWRHLVFGDGGSVAIDPTGRHHYGTDERYLPVVKLFDGAIDPNCITGGWLTNTCPKLLHAEGWYTAGARRPMEFDEHDAKLVLGYSDIWKEVNSEAPATAQMDQFSRHSHWQNVDFSTNEFACDQRAWVDLAIAPGNEEGVYGLTVSYVCSAGVQESRLLRRAAPIVINSTGQPALELVDLPFPNMAATQVTIDPLNAHRIWVTISGYSADKKVFHSSDRGDTWTNWDPLGSLPNLPVNDIVYQNGTEDGLYIATDAGVYYRNGSEAEVAWEPFYAALPNVRVNDLDINYCAGKLRAGTWGRGLWESDLAEQPTVARVITENTTWSIHKNLTQDVRVMPGATLTITNTVNFAPNTALIIEPGASVIVDGGLLHNSCGKEWKGVQVLGNSNLAQNPTNQGYFELRNGGVVDNAAIGILVGDLNDLTKGGGVVKIKGTQAQPGGVVRDCRPAVQFRPYGQISNMQFETRNRSQFVHAVFEFTEGALQAELGTEELIKLDGVRGIAFQACTFRNTIANVPETHLLGHGLHTYGSRFVVTDACPTPGTPCTAAERVPTSFTGLDHGVHALGAPTNSMFTLENSSFSNTICGVYASGITGFTVRNNDFEITDRAIAFTHPTEEFWFGMPRGIYTYESFGFKLHDNVVHSEQANPVLPAEAIVVGYSRDHNDKIWKNTATNLSTGFVGEGVCASTEPGGYSASACRSIATRTATWTRTCTVGRSRGRPTQRSTLSAPSKPLPVVERTILSMVGAARRRSGISTWIRTTPSPTTTARARASSPSTSPTSCCPQASPMA